MQVSLRPACVQATLVSGWRRTRHAPSISQDWNQPDERQSTGPEELAAAMETAVADLLATMSASSSLRGSALEVDIADAFVHFDVAEGRFGADSDAQLQAVARACASELLGEGESLDVRWQLQADEQHLLVCAIPAALIEALRKAAHRHGLVLTHVRPSFASGWNRHARGLRQGVCAFAVGDDTYALVALIRDGIVEAVDAGARPGDPIDASAATPTRLDAQVQRLVAGLGIEPSRIQQFIAVLHGSDKATFSPRWTVHSNRDAHP